MLKTTRPTLSADGLSADRLSSPDRLSRDILSEGRSHREKLIMRRYEIAHLTDTNQIEETTRMAPAIAPFEECFAALGRGALVPTEAGPRAVEDVWPGDRIITASGGTRTLLWRGSITIVPSAPNARPENSTLTRITADALGPQRPAPDLVLGPAARMAHSAPGIQRLTRSATAFIPARDFIDHAQIIALTPTSAVPVYQLGFARQERLNVNGIEVETLHPGALHMLGLSSEMQGLLMSMFPHLSRIGEFGELLHPRIRLRDLDIFDVA